MQVVVMIKVSSDKLLTGWHTSEAAGEEHTGTQRRVSLCTVNPITHGTTFRGLSIVSRSGILGCLFSRNLYAFILTLYLRDLSLSQQCY